MNTPMIISYGAHDRFITSWKKNLGHNLNVNTRRTKINYRSFKISSYSFVSRSKLVMHSSNPEVSVSEFSMHVCQVYNLSAISMQGTRLCMWVYWLGGVGGGTHARTCTHMRARTHPTPTMFPQIWHTFSKISLVCRESLPSHTYTSTSAPVSHRSHKENLYSLQTT